MNQYSSVLILYLFEIFFMVIVVKSYLKIKKSKNLLFEPVVFFILGSSFIYLFIPLLMNIFGWSWHNVVLSETSYIEANLYTLGYILATLFFYILFEYSIFKKNIHNSYEYYKLSKKQNIVLIFLFLIPILIDTIYLLKYILSFDYAYYLANRIILRKGMGLIILVSYMGTLIVPLFFASLLTKIKHKRKFYFILSISFFVIFILLPFLLAYVVMGNRLTAFILLIMLFMVYIIVMKKRFTLFFYIKLFVGGIALLLFFTFLGYVRSVQGDLNSIDFSLLLTVIGDSVQHAFVANFGNFEHLVWLMDHKQNWDAIYGETYIAGFTNLIPRFLWENKLLGGGPHLKNIIHPGSYDLSGANITSYTTGVAIESYMNFKVVGFIILPFFHAFILAILKWLTYKIKGNIILLLIYIYLLFAINLLLMFGEFLGIFTRTVIVVMPFIIFYSLTKKTTFKRKLIC